MIVVHHLTQSRSQRVLWLLEELGLPYEIVRHERDPETLLAPSALREVHPLGKAPVVVDGPLVLAESGAILDSLVERHGPQLRPPPGTPAWERYRYWMHYAEGSLMPPLLLKLVFDQIERRAPWPIRPVAKAIAGKVKSTLVTPNLQRHLDFLEAELARGPWFTGEAFSAADVQMSFPIEAAAARAGLDQRRPRLMDWLQRIHGRAAYQRAIERGGPFDIPA